MLAGMGGVSYHRLVAAVREAGGFGCLGASTMRADKMVDEIAAVRGAHRQALRRRPAHRAAPARHGDPGQRRSSTAAPGVRGRARRAPRRHRPCHGHNVLVVNMCGKVRHAVAAVEAGCDIVVAQGTEAGGHTGQVATMALVPQIVDAVGDRVPVVAAGGLFDGRGLAAALALGADGVWIGTRFIATPEARGVAGYKDALLAHRARTARSSPAPTPARPAGWCATTTRSTSRSTPTSSSPSRPAVHRVGPGRRQPPRRRPSTPRHRPGREFLPAGQGAGAIHELVPAGDLVRRFVAEAEATLDHLAGLRA